MTDRTTDALRRTMAAIAETAPEGPELRLIPRRRSIWMTPALITALAFALMLVPAIFWLPSLGDRSELRERTPAEGAVWLRIPDAEATRLGGAGDQHLRGVAVFDGLLVAVGTDTAGGDVDAAVWTSPDGITWARVPDDEAVFGGAGDQFMFGVAASDRGVVAVGKEVTGNGVDAAVWTSPDGLTWTRVPDGPGVLGGAGDQQLLAVTAHGSDFLAGGSDTPTSGETRAAVWTSADGVNWTRVPHEESVFGGPANLTISAVAAGDLGFIAVGTDDIDGYGDAAVWTSPDGATWSRTPNVDGVLGGPGTEAMYGVAMTESAVVAVGVAWFGVETFRAAVWTSSDGVTWTRVPDSPDLAGTGIKATLMSSVAGTDDGLIAVGFESGLSLESDPAVWTSPDGIAWTRVSGRPGLSGSGAQAMVAVVMSPDGPVAVGWDGAEGYQDVDAVIWVATE